jgi:hypothetical protein
MSENSFRFPYGLIEAVAPSLQTYTEFGGYKSGQAGRDYLPNSVYVAAAQAKATFDRRAPPEKAKWACGVKHAPVRNNPAFSLTEGSISGWL